MSVITVPDAQKHTGTTFDPTITTFAWFNLTNECNECCTQCYAGSGPLGRKSLLSTERWKELLTEAKDAGIQFVQFIGGEPTVYPQLADLIRHAATIGLRIEVFTNLVDISEENWAAFTECSVSLATSFYSATEEMHDRVTNSTGNQPRIVANIKRALSLGLQLRVGLIRVFEDQGVAEAMTFLKSLGVTNVDTDDVRGIGRGSVHDTRRKEDALCGKCARGKVVVDYLGRVYPCVFSQWLVLGNVRKSSLTSILHGDKIVLERQRLTNVFQTSAESDWCKPDDCMPSCAPRSRS